MIIKSDTGIITNTDTPNLIDSQKVSMRKNPVKIAIASGKGGTGKTFISTNLFAILSKKNIPVSLVDCDAEEPNDHFFFIGDLIEEKVVTVRIPSINSESCRFCGKCHEYCNYNAIFYLPMHHQISVLEELCHSCGACLVACGHHAITEKEMNIGHIRTFFIKEGSSFIEARVNIGVYSPVNVIKAAIKEADNQNITLLDSPPGTSCPFIHTVATADYVVLVAEPTPFGMSDFKKSIEVLKKLNKPYGVIINKSTLGNRNLYEYIEQEQIELLMKIPYESEIAVSYSEGKIISDLHPKWHKRFEILYEQIKEKTCK